MRDLDQLEEIDDSAPSRRVAVLIMAALSTAGLVFAMGILLRGESASGQLEDDPLLAFDAIDRAVMGRAEADGEDAKSEDARNEHAPATETELTFHRSLISDQSPELLAAIEAANAELRSLEAGQRGGEGISIGEDKTPLRNLALALAENHDVSTEVEKNARSDDAEAKNADRSTRFELPRAKTKSTENASEESSGDEPQPATPIDRGYALQVGSYKNRADAELFAKDLEKKGYDVFIERATIEGRGEFHRVRLGPFAHRGEALRLRSSFEAKERIYPLLVRLEGR